MERTELLAYSTRTLLGDHFVRTANQDWLRVLALGAALLTGRLALRRNPLHSLWRVSLVLLAILILAVFNFFQGVWLDPVFPTAACLTAYLLVTQFTFSLERLDKERSRFLLNRFVAPEVVDELLATGGSRWTLSGQRERVAVLFADVRGFTQFAEAHTPEEVMKAVNAYLHVMTEALHEHGGLLDKYTGDGLMAMFRIDRGVSVKQAVACALKMRDNVLQLSASRASGGDRSLRVGLSLHVGEAVVGLVGNLERQVNFTALGHTVVVAARLQSLASGGEVIASQEIFQAAGDEFAMEQRPPVAVKGVSHPVIPYLVKTTTGTTFFLKAEDARAAAQTPAPPPCIPGGQP
jgi:adenylate cyclase